MVDVFCELSSEWLSMLMLKRERREEVAKKRNARCVSFQAPRRVTTHSAKQRLLSRAVYYAVFAAHREDPLDSPGFLRLQIWVWRMHKT